MTEVTIKMSVASATAARMSQAANALSAIQAPSVNAGQTTVTGNTNAQATIQQTTQALNNIVSAFNADISKITTVANEFARVDAEQAETFNAFDAVSPLGRRHS
jgi:type VII secretion effector (TIGR04197 family)